MELKDFLKKVVINIDGQRMYLTEITSPYFETVTVEPDATGHHTFYSWPTINGDAFKTGALRFEDTSLLEPFRKAYDAYCRTEDAHWEEYGYWLRRD